VRLAAAGGDDFALSARPVVNDLLTLDREGVVRVDVVEVAEAEQDVVDRLVGYSGWKRSRKRARPSSTMRPVRCSMVMRSK